jgi:acetolactate synthase regulatory subunit
MQAFHVRYRNTQGSLMRILNAVSRRGLDLISVHAEAAGEEHLASLLLEVNAKQVGQLFREWYSIADVVDVRTGAALHPHSETAATWTGAHPPASEGIGEQARAALA